RRRTRPQRHPSAPAPQPRQHSRHGRHRPHHPIYRTDSMKIHPVRTYRSDENLAREDQLAWKIAEVASENIEATDAVADMVINRVIDNASVAVASLTR